MNSASNKTFAIIIPARYESKRLPGKPLIKIKGKEMILHTAERCIEAIGDKSNVYVATDDTRIGNLCKSNNIQVIYTSSDCKTGTDRVKEAWDKLNTYDFIINVQGDEPLVLAENIRSVIDNYLESGNTTTGIAKLKNEADFFNRNIVKFVCSNNNLLYASRAPIPSSKTGEFYKGYCHVPIYAFNRADLETFYGNKTPIESIEDIEILRFLELGIKINTVELLEYHPAVDVFEDIEKVNSYKL